MTVITSTDNRIVKLAASLSEKKYRDREGLYIVEGPNLVRELLENGKARFIFIRAESASEEAMEIAERADESGLAVYKVNDSVFSKVTQTETPQGILAVFEKPSRSREDFFKIAGDKNILVVDRVQDPGNVGTLLRTCEAAGFAGAMIIKGSGDPFSPKAVRASAGSSARLPLIFAESINDGAALLKKNGKRLIATDMKGKAFWDADLAKNCALTVSNEGNGASGELLKLADEIISIPMTGQVESLNAAIACGIIMFESRRQNL